MNCPYCNGELKYYSGELYCKDGDCLFSKHIEGIFNEKISCLYKIQKSKTKDSDALQGRFYCVNCGNKMMKSGLLHEKCDNCGFEINKALYHEIIELNPHQELKKE